MTSQINFNITATPVTGYNITTTSQMNSNMTTTTTKGTTSTGKSDAYTYQKSIFLFTILGLLFSMILY
jgi:hypothetical protein